jgi:hypothetical protein
MASPREDSRAAELIGPLKNEHMKTHIKRDSLQRVEVLYEAPAHIGNGEPCLATVYHYEASNTVPTNTLEKIAVWDDSWETDIEAILVNGDVGYTEL